MSARLVWRERFAHNKGRFARMLSKDVRDISRDDASPKLEVFGAFAKDARNPLQQRLGRLD